MVDRVLFWVATVLLTLGGTMSAANSCGSEPNRDRDYEICVDTKTQQPVKCKVRGLTAR